MEPKEKAAGVSAASRSLALLASVGVGLNSLRSNNARPDPPAAALLSTASTAWGTEKADTKFQSQIQITNSKINLAVQRAYARVLPLFIYVAKCGISSLSRPAGRERAGGESGAKMKTNKSASISTTHFDAIADRVIEV